MYLNISHYYEILGWVRFLFTVTKVCFIYIYIYIYNLPRPNSYVLEIHIMYICVTLYITTICNNNYLTGKDVIVETDDRTNTLKLSSSCLVYIPLYTPTNNILGGDCISRDL